MTEKDLCCDTPCVCDNPCMPRVCRRDFIKMALAAGFLAGCSPSPQPTAESAVEPTVAPTVEPTVEPTVAPTGEPVAAPQALPPAWPTDGWLTSTPEEQGMDSERLVRLLEFVLKDRYQFAGLYDLLVARNGYVVLDANFITARKGATRQLVCASRSILSALIGIAIDKGYIDGVDQPMLSFFPDRATADGDPRKEAVTLQHLLTNTSGLQGRAQADEEGDQIQRILDRPMAADPGADFGFSAGPYLSSAILQAATGMDPLDFAKEHLFGPLGITDVTWETDSDGVRTPTGIRLTSHDLAKFGHLYLSDGAWDGEQIVPAEWVADSLTSYTNTGCGLGFGYQWWIHGFGACAAQSGRAQCFAAPEQGVLTVTTSEPGGVGQSQASGLVEYFIVPAVKSSEPLPENPAMVAQLESLVKEVEGLFEP